MKANYYYVCVRERENASFLVGGYYFDDHDGMKKR
jgi:hypothetical protein